MKALLLLVIAIATCAAHGQQPTPCLKLNKIEIEKHVLHRNGATQATLMFEGKHCYVLNEAKNIGRQGPVFEITSQPGISSSVETIDVVQFDPAKMRLADFRAGEIAVKLNLTATPDAPLGKHSLPVLVHYQVMDGGGNVSDETLTFNMPIKIVKAEQFRPPFEERHPVWAKVLLPFEVIAFIPLCILLWLVGAGGCL